MTSAYSFQFDPVVPFAEAQATLQLALIAVEGLYGQLRVHLDAEHQADPHSRTIAIDGSTEVGVSLVNVFANMITREFGGAAVTMKRIGGGQKAGV